MGAAAPPSPLTGLPLLPVADDGTEAEVRVTLGRPRPDGGGGDCWSCVLDLPGLGERPHRVFGADGLQAVAPALRLAEARMTLVARARRARWLDPETREPADPAASFGRGVSGDP